MRDSYDVAVLDVRMRPFDGMELYRRLRMVEPGLAICFLTAYADTIKDWPPDVLLLQKPISLEGLELALEDAEARNGSDKRRFKSPCDVVTSRAEWTTSQPTPCWRLPSSS